MMHPGQHRLRTIQLVNWGTFNGSFTLPVPRAGLLVTGPSGSGKSSLLDALASVLVQPKWLSFNAAAQEGGGADRHRSVVSYIRGAYKREADEATGEVATSYLRPGATWSGIALTFDDGAGVRTSLVRLLHLPRGTNAADAVNSLFVLADGEVDLAGLEPLLLDGINTRRLRAAHPSWTTHTTYAAFAAKLQRRLGLASDQAQRLLHKTQSAKNLTSLDTLLRDFMLDEPVTFELADQAVAQFQELSQAHNSVLDATRQVETLRPLRAIDQELAELAVSTRALAAQEEHLHTVTVGLAVEATTAELARHEALVDALTAELARADAELAARQGDRDAARVAHDNVGGWQLGQFDQAIDDAAARVHDVSRRREQTAERCAEFGLVMPDEAAGFSAFADRLERLRAERAETEDSRGDRYALIDRAAQAKRDVDALETQLRALAGQRSNLGERLLTLRQLLLAGSGVARERLPFVGELIDVRPEEGRWRGAIERVLRPFAQTLLVPDDLYPFVSEFVDRRHLGVRLVYERVPAGEVAPRAVDDPASLTAKVTVADAECAPWVRAELARRFDYRCVESIGELRSVARGVTLAGQVKHSVTRHEKDDRTRIDDRTTWILGTSTELKRVALEEALAAAGVRLGEANDQRDAAEAGRETRLRQVSVLGGLLELTWDQLDLAGPQRNLQVLTDRRDLFRASASGLEEAARRLREAEGSLTAAREARDRILGRLSEASAGRLALTRRLALWQAELDAAASPPEQARAALVARLSAVDAPPERAEAIVRGQLADERTEATQRTGRLAGRGERIMLGYKQSWPLPAQDWMSQIDFLPDFLARLDALERDRLPEFVERFHELLRTQSQNNIGILSTRLRSARREVRERVDPINASLRLTDYSPGHHLHVRVDDRRLPEVGEFMQTLSAIAGGTLSDTLDPTEDQASEQAEKRFALMKALLERLASSEAADVKWRTLCLDTRQHVKFIAEVRDDQGRPVDYFTGAGGLSGGERQKLVIFCLAAALRYQLARDGAATPAYGLVVLDEAFDKTDPAFTKAGLDVFRQFGFQLLLATPLKMLQTLEDYVGGAAVVFNESGQGSRLEFLDFSGGGAPPEEAEAAVSVGAQDALL